MAHKNRKRICIVGMHRSGTSMWARLLEQCGVYFGEKSELIGPQPDNPNGYWENIAFQNINEEILAGLDSAWDMPPALDRSIDFNDKKFGQIRENAEKLVMSFDKFDVWGWKDPRTSLVLPFWRALIPDMKFIWCLRNPLDVAHSLRNRGYSSELFGFTLWYVYNMHILNNVPASQKIITHYDSCFINPYDELKRVLKWLNLTVPDATIQQAVSKIDPALKRNHSTLQDLKKIGVSDNILNLYIDLCGQVGPVYKKNISYDSRMLNLRNRGAADVHVPSLERERKESSKIKPIAFYLPQYHTIPENDEWWGEGFTEWTNVAKAKPLYPGHYQPHIPLDLGYYDLTDPVVRQAQADMAREYGIYGFCYYHYWFNGKMLLERPFNEVLSSGKPDFPFCLCWANENWTRAWDGKDKDVLMSQKYTREDDLMHFDWLIKAFRDDRYIRVDGKPLFLIYRASNLPDPLETTTLWREEAKKRGLGDLFLCRVESFPNERGNPLDFGFDAAVEFQPDWVQFKYITRSPVGEHPELKKYSYPEYVEKILIKPEASYKRFACITPSWDNTARRNSRGLVMDGANPCAYEFWFKNIVRKLTRQSGEKLLFINAWNEWGEGNHLEPDVKFGYGYLEATQRALFESDSGLHLKREIENLEDELDKKNKRINILMNSYSWKITRPLRDMHKIYNNLLKK